MTSKELILAVRELGLKPKTLAYLLGVTPRAINMWFSSDREIPGPVIAYIKLLKSIPRALQVREFSRINKENLVMYDGMYLVNYEGRTGYGSAVLVFVDGIVFGHDTGVIYDGIYEPCPLDPKFMNVRLRLTVPKGVALVQGVPAQSADYSFEISVRAPAQQEAPFNIETPYGMVLIQLSFLRSLPSELAA